MLFYLFQLLSSRPHTLNLAFSAVGGPNARFPEVFVPLPPLHSPSPSTYDLQLFALTEEHKQALWEIFSFIPTLTLRSAWQIPPKAIALNNTHRPTLAKEPHPAHVLGQLAFIFSHDNMKKNFIATWEKDFGLPLFTHSLGVVKGYLVEGAPSISLKAYAHDFEEALKNNLLTQANLEHLAKTTQMSDASPLIDAVERKDWYAFFETLIKDSMPDQTYEETHFSPSDSEG